MRERVWRSLHDRPLIAAVVALSAILLLLVLRDPDPFSPPSPGSPSVVLAVADLRGHALVLLETGSGEARRVHLSGGPHELVQLDDGRLVLSLEQSAQLAVVDPRLDPPTLETLDLGGLPHGLAIDGTVLYVTDRSSDALRRFAVDGAVAHWRELPPLPGGDGPHIVAALPGGELAVAHAGDSTLRIGAHAFPVSQLPETVSVAPGGGAVATAGALGGRVEVFDAAGRDLWSLAVGGRPVRVVFAPDGATLAVSLSAAHTVVLVRPDGSTDTVAVGGAPDGLAFDAAGRFLFVGDLALGRVSVVDVASAFVITRFAVGESAGALMVLEDAATPS